VAFISHLDTVFTAEEERENDFCWRVEADRIHGPGTVDIKGGTVVAHLTLAALQECCPQWFGDIHWQLFLNSAEEVPSPDFGRLCRDRIPATARAALVLEGGGRAGATHSIVTARKGRALFRVVVEGRSAHAGGNHDRGANAIAQLAHTIQRIEALTNYECDLTFNVGVVAGGTVVNRVPERAWAEVEMRAFEPEVYARGIAALRKLAEEVVVRSPADQHPCRVTVELVSENLPWPANADTDRLFAVWQEAGRTIGLTVVRETRGGVSDGNHTWDHVPTLDGLGPCGEHAHCAQRDPAAGKDQEYVEPATLVTRAWLNAVALHALLSRG
jgi:glutamate carboxypeptidase